MEPRIISHDGFHALGLSRKLAPEEQNEEVFKSIWSGFEERIEEIAIDAIDGAFYGLSFPGDQPGGVEYLAAMVVHPSAIPPEGMLLREVPTARYAVFECAVQSIGDTYRFIFQQWLPSTSFGLSPGVPVFERYPPEGEATSPVLIHVPITEAA